MEEWKQYRLIDILDKLIDYRGKTPKKTTSGIPLITAKIIKNGRIDTPTEFISVDDYDSWMVRGFPKVGDVVITTEAPLGEVAQLDNENIALAQRVVTLRGKAGVLDNTYLKYYLMSNVGQQRIKARETGTTVTGIKQSELREVLVDCPPYQFQQKIASILKSLDDKIEVDKRINDNLEQQAQALFKSWFVDFEPFKDGEFVESELGMIPKGWRVYNLSEFLPVITGKKDANVAKGGAYPFFSCSQDFGWTDDYSFDGNAILVAGNGDFNVKMYNGRFEAYQRTYVLIPYNPQYTAWLFYAVKYHLKEITSAARGSVIKFITKGNLADFRFPAPSNIVKAEIIEKFDYIRRMVASNEHESRCLASLRDTLLPKLMSGEIKVINSDLINEMLEKGIR